MAKRTPIEIKKLNGTFRDDRQLPDYARLDAMDITPMPPPTLHEKAHQTWYTQVSAMQQMKTLTVADLVLLEAFCYQKYLYDISISKIMEDALIDETNNGSTKMVSLYIKIQNDAITNMINLSKKLGFSPLDRSSIGVKSSEPNDPLNGLMKRK